MVEESRSLVRGRAFLAFRSRDFRLLWSGQTVSMIGDTALFVAAGWKAFTLGGAQAVSVVLTLQAVGLLATLLLGGALADRYSRRALMVASDVLRCALVSVLVVLDATGALTTGRMAAVALGVGLAAGFFMPAFGGLVPLVVEQPQLASANALIGTSRQASLVVGPALAGLLYDEVGSAVVFALDAASFLVSMALVLLARPRVVEREPGEGPIREIAAGLRYVASVPWLWITIGLFSVFLMVAIAPYQVLMPRLIADHFGRGVGAYGVLMTCQGAGMIVGTLAFGQWSPRRRRGYLAYAGWIGAAAFLAGVALAPWYELAAAFAGVRGACLGFGIALWGTMLMELVPDRLLSRVISVDYFGSLGLMPLGLVLAGGAASLASSQLLLTGGAALSTALFALALLHPRIRGVD